jgi:hypothetical protein
VLAGVGGCGGCGGHMSRRVLLEDGWMEGPAVETWGGTGWEKALAGAGFRGLRRAISHRGD